MLAIRLFGRFRACSPGLIAKASTSTSRCYRVPYLIAYAGGSTMLVRSCSQFLRVRHAMCNLEKEEHDPWILLPRQKDTAKSAHPLIKRVVLFPVTVIVAVYEALRMTLRFLVLSFRFMPLLITYPVCSRFQKTYDLWWRVALWHVQASGPTLIKLGQWASTRRDVFSKEFCDRLSILHTKTKKRRLFRNHDKVLRHLFGSEVLKHKEKIFPVIEPYSIGSGCIAHVYRLTMDMGEYEKVTGVRVPGLEGAGKVEMAVKVAERGVEEMIEMDLSIVSKLARWTQIFMPSLKYLDPVGAIEQFEMVLRRQVDLRSEARALHKFQENFDPVKTGIRFPIVVAYNKKSIIETYEYGMYINRLVAEENNPDLKSKQSHAVRRKIAVLGARALLKMVFVDNFVHGDLHPGNILIRFNDKEASGVHFAPPSDSLFQKAKDFLRSTFRIRGSPKLAFSDSPDLNDEPTLVLLDTGIAISETPKNLRNLRRIFRCIVEKRGYRAGELILEESPHQQCNDKELFCKEVEQLVTKARSERSLRTLNISALMSQLFNIVADHRVQLDSAFTSILLSIMVLEGFGRSLDPDLDLFQCARPYLLNVML
ncbi:unnamed protein product, partial [Mesorhabditis belari]|uniref:ABC1 atypical kinase-like domain-containing protein n=1 Tax=Mesorhabditis belari TaxID=2138241 RepID=A0AAF3J579_9BILA